MFPGCGELGVGLFSQVTRIKIYIYIYLGLGKSVLSYSMIVSVISSCTNKERNLRFNIPGQFSRTDQQIPFHPIRITYSVFLRFI